MPLESEPFDVLMFLVFVVIICLFMTNHTNHYLLEEEGRILRGEYGDALLSPPPPAVPDLGGHGRGGGQEAISNIVTSRTVNHRNIYLKR